MLCCVVQHGAVLCGVAWCVCAPQHSMPGFVHSELHSDKTWSMPWQVGCCSTVHYRTKCMSNPVRGLMLRQPLSHLKWCFVAQTGWIERGRYQPWQNVAAQGGSPNKHVCVRGHRTSVSSKAHPDIQKVVFTGQALQARHGSSSNGRHAIFGITHASTPSLHKCRNASSW